MAIFGSRRRGSSAVRQPIDANTSAAANIAARAASGSRPSSSAGLSSAAAAAALRSVTSSPELVGNIQTKRMVRRCSQSSLTGGGSQRGGSLQRRGSQGSMTERTFRSPSPGRNDRITSDTASPAFGAPPVPAIPRELQHFARHRSSSVEPPQRVYSPSPNGRTHGRANSMDRSSMPPPAAHKKGVRLSDVHEEQLERSESNRGVNFSRPRGPNSPMSSPPASPTTDKQYTHGTGGWFAEPVQSQKVKDDQQGDALEAKLARVQAASGQGVSKSNKTTSAQGTHLSRVGQPGVTGTAVASPQSNTQPQEMETVMVYDASSRTFVPQLKAKSKPAAPAPVQVAAPKKLAPGTYDPHTRTIVPMPQTSTPQSTARPARPTLETDLAPPPRNPARLSPTSSPRSSQILEPEEVPTPIVQTSEGPAVAYNATKSKRSSSLDVPSRDSPSVRGRANNKSPSPSRKTHFSASPVTGATIHDPPARDVSAAKSAMKHSPASSLRTTSPLAHFAGHPKGPSSETSETPSLASHDDSAKKKKKSVHVSFDEQPQVTEVVPVKSILADSDDEDFSKPRPALPSFGSVRKNRVVAEKVTEMAPERHDHSNDHAVGGILRNAPGSANANIDPAPPEVTSKEVSGYISDDSVYSDDTENLGRSNATSTPKPASKSTQEVAEQPDAANPVVRDFAPPKDDDAMNAGVPMINLSPPTPGTEDVETFGEQSVRSLKRQSADIKVPGQWSAEQENEPSSADTVKASVAPADIKATAPKIAPIMVHSPEESSPMLDPITETDSDDDSAEFSDAAEDPSEFEGGFASLDAIAVSPINTNTSPANRSNLGIASPPESPVATKTAKQAPVPDAQDEDTDDGDWSKATAYWSKLSKQQREQIEREHFSSDDEATPAPAVTRKKKNQVSKAPTASSPTVAKSSPSHREARPAQPAMKKSMRAQPTPTPVEPARQMRTSMRSGGFSSGSLRQGTTSLSPVESKGSLLKKSLRPHSSASLTASSADAAMVSSRDVRTSQDSSYSGATTSRPVSQVSAAPVVSSRLQKELANDSDSESSFKKKRRPSASNGDNSGRYSMARSMRAGPSVREERPVSPTPPRGRGRDSFSIRSLSPTGSLFGRKKQKDIRESIKGDPVEPKRTTLRTSQPPPKAATRKAVAPAKTSRFTSRFADSDDSDDDGAPPPRRGVFRSRFADSDDEEDEGLAPVRGIPRRAGQNDGDSTDLDDSDDELRRAGRIRQKQTLPLVPDPADINKAMDAARKKLGMTNGPSAAQKDQHDANQGSALSRGSLRKPSDEIRAEPKSRIDDPALSPAAKKKGFMGSILRRNRNSQASVMTVSSMAPGPSCPATKVPTSRPQSPATPGKLVRRSSGQPQTRQRMERGNSSLSTATAPPMVGESSWPLSDAPPVPAIPSHLNELKTDGRPATSDGSPVVRFSEDAGKTTYSTRTGKKKKFGLLRRAFGLND